MTPPLTPPMTRTLTRSIKNTIPTLALLVAILMLSGCVGQALNNLASKLEEDAKKGLGDLEDGLDDINKNGSNSPDPCIARNTCVDYTHWADTNAANPTTTPTANRFLTGTATGLATGGSDTGQITNLASIGGEATDGFAIFLNGDVHNAGILSTTRLGAPLRDNSTNAEWTGLFSERVGQGNIAETNITLMVSYSGTSGTITSTNIGRANAYSFTNVAFNNVGIITGTITRTADTSVGTVSGLIGAEGAVAVFHSNANATTSYVGGFGATPPSGS